MPRGSRHAEAWENFGATDPDWAVLTDPTLRGGGWNEHLDEFYASGVVDVDAHLADLPSGSGRDLAIDWGCGTGRLSLALARRFARVVGVDVSTSMIETTLARAAERGVTNIECRQVGELQPSNADLVYSLHVLQHLPSHRTMLATLDAMCANVGPGGFLMVHIPAAIHGVRARVQPRYRMWWLLTALGLSDAAARRLGGQGMSMRALSRREVERRIAKAGLAVLSVIETSRSTVTSARYIAGRPSS